MRALLVSSRNLLALFRGRQRLRDILNRNKIEFYVYDRCSLIDIDFSNTFFYVNSLQQLDEDTKRCIRRGLRRGSIVILELVPRARNDVLLLNKFLSPYGIEYTWLKVYDSINNNGVPLNPLMNAYLDGKVVENIVVEHAFHMRVFKAYRFIRGKDTAIVMDPRTEEALPMPSGENICSGAIVYNNGRPQVIVFSGYVLSDTALENESNNELLSSILTLIR